MYSKMKFIEIYSAGTGDARGLSERASTNPPFVEQESDYCDWRADAV